MILLQLINIGLISAHQQRIDGIIVVTVLRRRRWRSCSWV
ncbi:hypothetical protein LTSEADE_1391, partial [Salmonella enterica subsp. enterica serovar Adelaide str. A4-669]